MRFRVLGICLAVLGTFHCAGQPDRIDKLTENGVEVVLNHETPYRLKDEPSKLTLENIRTIDTENDAIAASGVTDIYLFDVDRGGNIYIVVPPTGPRDCVYKFSPEGKLVTTFGRLGQGPNELFDLRADPREKVNQYANPAFVTMRDRLSAELEAWRKK